MQLDYFGYALPDPFRDSADLERLYGQDLEAKSRIELEGERYELMCAISRAHKQTHKAVYVYVSAWECYEALEWMEQRVKAIDAILGRGSYAQ